MNTLTHPVAPEEIMSLLDGELPLAEAQTVAQHIGQCAECTAIRDQLRGTSAALAAWTIPAPSPAMDRIVEERLAASARAQAESTPRAYTPWTFGNWRLWAIGGGGAVAAILAIILFAASISYRENHVESRQPAREIVAEQKVEPSASLQQAGVAGIDGYVTTDALQAAPASPPARARTHTVRGPLQGGVIGGAVPAPAPPAPMIARAVSLIVVVNNISTARAALDTILTQHHGYAAQLTLDTPENGARSFQASLRVPAPELPAALDALRSLGRVQTETQSGEEVTQQHADLAARLTNARETEQRLREILQQRTGKMEDVLDVEEKISQTRGEIEQMEAEQQALEHRIDFATVDLRLAEQYEARLSGATASVATRLHNSFIAGLRNAGSSLLGIVLFIEEAGPAALLWILILGTPIALVWRRYRKARHRQS